VRIISDVVESLELSALLRRYEWWRSRYHPAMMLKVLIYAYSMGIYSSRQIAKELKTDTAFMFLSGMQTPDFHTICLFRSQACRSFTGGICRGRQAVRFFRDGRVRACSL